MKAFLNELISVVPSERQLRWYETEMYAFVHFGVNTFTDREWGDGKEDEKVFAPRKLDCRQWVRAMKAAGMKGMVLTAKHHDGFCLWPTKYTEHCVRNASVTRDVVGEAAEACREAGMKFGVYLSPWDRNSPLYGTEAYNDYFCNQLTELLTQYGDIFCVWFDNACAEGPNGKKQVYDFPRYIRLIRELQPGAVIFNDFGPDVRWCGNEGGLTRENEWSVVPSELVKYSEIQTGPGPRAEEGDLSFLYSTGKDLGSLSLASFSRGLCFTPCEINTSIRRGWFWHSEEDPRPLDLLYQIYLNSVGGNACLHLNIPPDRDGLVDERDVRRLRELGNLIQRELGTELPVEIRQRGRTGIIQAEYEILLRNPEKIPKYVVLSEDLTKGQRVESFQILKEAEGFDQYPIFQGGTVGYRKICRLFDGTEEQNPLLFSPDRPAEKLVVRIAAARGPVHLKDIRVF